MTDEARGATPDEAPVPPTSTRWSEDAVPDDHAPAPPFVPGRDRPSAPAPAAEPDAEEAVVGEAEAGEPAPFPFEAPFDVEEERDEEETPAGIEPAKDDFPFERFDIEGRSEAAGAEDQAGAAGAAEPELAGGWSPADMVEEQRDEGRVPEADRDPTAPSAPSAPTAPRAPAAEDAAEDVAVVLDRLAGLLRSGGEAAVRREVDSPDRLTAVLAGILAGYLSGRS